MKLLVDMGNSRLKWAIFDNQYLTTGKPLQNEQVCEQALLELWQHLNPQQLAIVCVTANQRLELVIAVALSLWSDIKITRISSQAQGFGITNAYRHPEKLGADRWVALCAVRHFYSLPACVIDCGTAITVDLVNGEGQHLGGFITPGLTLMKKSLAVGTDALPFNNDYYRLEPANFTEGAIYSGTLLAVVGMIEKILASQTSMEVILTGGDAGLIASYLNVSCALDSDLVLRGLAVMS
jgi:type III pantothenate kinase